MDELVKAIGKSKPELSFRMQFFDQNPTEENLSNALDKFTTWRDVIASLPKSPAFHGLGQCSPGVRPCSSQRHGPPSAGCRHGPL